MTRLAVTHFEGTHSCKISKISMSYMHDSECTHYMHLIKQGYTMQCATYSIAMYVHK